MPDREIKPVEVHEQFGERFEDRTFGCISFSRTHGTPQPLFGSSIKHSNQIMLEVKTAHLWRNLNMDRVHGDKILLRVIMSLSWLRLPSRATPLVAPLTHIVPENWLRTRHDIIRV